MKVDPRNISPPTRMSEIGGKEGLLFFSKRMYLILRGMHIMLACEKNIVDESQLGLSHSRRLSATV